MIGPVWPSQEKREDLSSSLLFSFSSIPSILVFSSDEAPFFHLTAQLVSLTGIPFFLFPRQAAITRSRSLELHPPWQNDIDLPSSKDFHRCLLVPIGYACPPRHNGTLLSRQKCSDHRHAFLCKGNELC